MAKRKPVPMDEDVESIEEQTECGVSGCHEFRMMNSDVCTKCYVVITKFCEDGTKGGIKR